MSFFLYNSVKGFVKNGNNQSKEKKMHNQTSRDKITDFLLKRHDVIFAYLFGSHTTGLQNEMSDIDLAVYTTGEMSLLEQGSLVSHLEMITGYDVDLVILNALYERNPELAYTIVFNGELLLCKDNVFLTDYRRKSLLYFFDTEPLRRMVYAGLEHRLAAGTYAIFENA